MLISRYKDKYLEFSQELCYFNKMVVIDSRIHDFTSPDNLSRFPLPDMQNSSMLLVIANILLLGLQCHAGQPFGPQVLFPGRIICCFLPLETFITPSGSMEASLQEDSFQVRSRLGSVFLVSDTHGVFNNRDLPSTSERQPSKTAIACVTLGVSWTTLTNKLKGDFRCLVLVVVVGGLSDSLWLWRGVFSAQAG